MCNANYKTGETLQWSVTPQRGIMSWICLEIRLFLRGLLAFSIVAPELCIR